jgi:hypothetical protein
MPIRRLGRRADRAPTRMPTVHPAAMPPVMRALVMRGLVMRALVMRAPVMRALVMRPPVALRQPETLPVATVDTVSREVAMHQPETVLRVRALDATTAAARGRTAASVRIAMDEAVEAVVSAGGDAAASRVIGRRVGNARTAENARTAATAIITSHAMQARQSFWLSMVRPADGLTPRAIRASFVGPSSAI